MSDVATIISVLNGMNNGNTTTDPTDETNSGSSGGGAQASNYNTDNVFGVEINGPDIVSLFQGVFTAISCYGSTWTPRKAKDFMESHTHALVDGLTPYINTSSPSAESEINAFVSEWFDLYADEKSWVQTSQPHRCSRNTINAMTPVLDEYLNIRLNELATRISQNGVNASVVESTHYHVFNLNGQTYEYPIPQIVIQGSGTTIETESNNGGIKQLFNPSSNVKLAGFNPIFLLLILAFLFSKKTRQQLGFKR